MGRFHLVLVLQSLVSSAVIGYRTMRKLVFAFAGTLRSTYIDLRKHGATELRFQLASE